MINAFQHAPVVAGCITLTAYLISRTGIQIDVGRIRLKIRRQRR